MPAEIDIEVVSACLADFPDLTRFVALLSEDERARALRFKVEEPQRVFTLARGLLRLELGKRLGVDASQIRFDLRPSGKPDLRRSDAASPDWRFSVSHAGPHIALGFARGVDIGIDIERVNRKMSLIGIAERYFAPREIEILSRLPDEARTRSFFAGWTRKEAIVKAQGLTMAECLASLTVDLDPHSVLPGYEDAAADHPACRLASFAFPDRELMGAMAVRAPLTPRLIFGTLSGARFD